MQTRELFLENAAGLVLCCPSGTYYETQASGICCTHPGVEGAYMPFNIELAWALNKDLEELHPGCCHTMDWQENLEVQKLLHKYHLPLAVYDGANTEAWVEVVIEGQVPPGRWLHDYEGHHAFLTWENCD